MSKYDEYALVEKYKDQVSFVHLYGPEPHPKRPDKNFDTVNYPRPPEVHALLAFFAHVR